MMQSLPWLFTNGIQNGEARASASPQPRLADAVNVHVRPENLNVLSMRPRALRVVDEKTDNKTRIVRAGEGVARLKQNLLEINALGTGNLFNEASANIEVPSIWSVTGVTDYHFSGAKDHAYSAFVDGGNGASAVFAASCDPSGVAGRLSVQLTSRGVRYPEMVITDNLYNSDSRTGDSPIFFACANVASGYSVICTVVESGDVKIVLFASTDPSKVPVRVTELALPFGGNSPKLRSADVVTGTTSVRIIFAFTRGNSVIVSFIDALTGTMITPNSTIVSPSGGVPYNGCAAIAVTDKVNSKAHIYVDTGDETELDVSIYEITYSPTISSASIGSISMSGISGKYKYHSIYGGEMLIEKPVGPPVVEVGSYFYASGHTWGILHCQSTGGFQTSGAPPIVPMGRMHADGNSVGCRIIGNQGSVSGVWRLRDKILVYSDFLGVPLAYYSVSNGSSQSVDTEAVGLDVKQGFRGMCVAQSQNSIKAIFRNRNTGTLDVFHAELNEVARTVTGAKTDILIGAVPRYWDGVSFVPAGIPQPPSIDLVATDTGGSLVSGTYLYAAVWEWFDSAGERQQSGADIQSVTIPPGDSKVELQISQDSMPIDERLSNYGRPITLVVYRSAPGSDTMRRIAGLELEVNMGSAYTTSGPILVVDDGTFPIGFETLYVSPGDNNELEATALEETYLLRPYSDRLIYVTKSYPDQLNYTKTKRQGRAIEPNQQLNFTMPKPATGLAVQDGNIYWLTRDNVFAFNPRFADDTGLDGGGVDAIPLSPGIGCTQPHSVVETAIGVIFFGERGPHVIPRGGGAPQFIGLDIERWFTQFPVCVASVFSPKTSEALFAMNSSDGADHCILVYNILLNQWFRWVIGDTETGGPVRNITSLEVSQEGELYLCANVGGTSYQTYCVDFSSPGATEPVDHIDEAQSRNIQVKVETASIRAFAGGPAEEGRIDRVAIDCSSAPAGTPQLLISESHDDGETWSTELPIQTGSRIDPPVYRLGRQRTRGVRIRMRTTYNGETNPTNQMRAPEQLAGLTVYGYKLGRATSGRQRG